MKESESIVFLQLIQRLRPLPAEIVVTCYLVEAGEYHQNGRLTELGQQQVSKAADYIRQRAGQSVTVLQYNDPTLTAVSGTGDILAEGLHGPVFDDEVYLAVFWALAHTTPHVNAEVLPVLWHILGCKAELRLAMPMNHLGASPVIDDYPEGAEPGSVHVLSFTYDRKTGQIIARGSSK